MRPVSPEIEPHSARENPSWKCAERYGKISDIVRTKKNNKINNLNSTFGSLKMFESAVGPEAENETNSPVGWLRARHASMLL